MNDLDLTDPFREMKKARKRLDDFFTAFPDFRRGIRQPLIDISDKGKQLEITAELPGAKKEDIELEIEDDSIRISAQSLQSTERKKEDYYFQERSLQSFQRIMPLPVQVNSAKAEAEFKNGILTVLVPKKHVKELKGHKVKIK